MAGLAEYINPSASTKQRRYERSKGWMDSVDDFIAPVTGAISGAVDDFEDAVTPFIPPELRHLPLSPSDIGGGALTLAQMINPLPMIDQAMTDSGDAGDGTQTVAGADGQWYDRELTLDERAGLATGSAVEATAAVLPAAIYGRVMGSSAGSAMTEALTGYTAQTSDEVGEGLAKAIAKQTGKPKEGMTRRTFNKGAAATAVGGSVAVAGGDIIVDAVKATAKKAAKAASKRGGPFADVFANAMKAMKEKEGELELSGISRTEIDVMRGRTIHDSDASIYATNADGEFIDPKLIEAHEAEQEALLAVDDANGDVVRILGIRGGLEQDDMAQLSDDQLEEMLDQITKYQSNIYYPEYSLKGGDGGPRPDLDPYEYHMAREENEEMILDAQELLRNEIATRKLPDDGTEGMTFEEIMAHDPDAPVEGEFAKLRRERAERIAREKAEELAKEQADQVWFEKYLPEGWKTGGF